MMVCSLKSSCRQCQPQYRNIDNTDNNTDSNTDNIDSNTENTDFWFLVLDFEFQLEVLAMHVLMPIQVLLLCFG